MGTSMFFPDLNVMALTFLGFSTVCDGNLSEFWACAWLSCLAICPIWFVKVWIKALVSCWSFIILTNYSNEVEEKGAGAVVVGVGTGGTRAACVGATLCWGGGCTFWNCWFCCCWLPWFPHLRLGDSSILDCIYLLTNYGFVAGVGAYCCWKY